MTDAADECRSPATSLRFRDPRLQVDFERDGFVVGPDLDRHAMDELRALWDEIGPSKVSGIWSNVHVLGPETNRAVDHAITEAFRPLVDQVMDNGRLAGASFLVKGVGPGSASEPHQDWNNVDERSALSLSMWCPLVDVDERNGALQVLPGTHRLRHTVRSLDTGSLTLGFDDELRPRLRSLPVPAGRCVFYAHNLFHGSLPNDGDRIRVAVTSGVLPRGVRHLHYRRGEGDTFEELEVEREFFLSGIPELVGGGLPGSARVAGVVTVPGGPLTRDEVLGPPGAGGAGAARSKWRRWRRDKRGVS